MKIPKKKKKFDLDNRIIEQTTINQKSFHPSFSYSSSIDSSTRLQKKVQQGFDFADVAITSSTQNKATYQPPSILNHNLQRNKENNFQNQNRLQFKSNSPVRSFMTNKAVQLQQQEQNQTNNFTNNGGFHHNLIASAHIQKNNEQKIDRQTTKSNSLANSMNPSSIQRIVIEEIEKNMLSESEKKRMTQLEQKINQDNPQDNDVEELVKLKINAIFEPSPMALPTVLPQVMGVIKSQDITNPETKSALSQALYFVNFGKIGAGKSKLNDKTLQQFIDALVEAKLHLAFNHQSNQQENEELESLTKKSKQKVNRYTSHVDPSKEITAEKGVISSISVGDEGNGHAFIYIEYLKNGVTPSTICTDLGVSGTEIFIKKEELQGEQKLNDLNLANKKFKSSWTVNMSQIKAALDKVDKVQQEEKDYRYTRKGSRVFGFMRTQKSINCARYVNKILKAAGIGDFSGIRYHTPYRTATGNSYTGKKISEKWNSWFTKSSN